MELTFYTTAGCHLCEQALELVQLAQQQVDFSIRTVEISEDDQLIEDYGIRIPVIALPNKIELNWPFTQQEIISIVLS